MNTRDTLSSCTLKLKPKRRVAKCSKNGHNNQDLSYMSYKHICKSTILHVCFNFGKVN